MVLHRKTNLACSLEEVGFGAENPFFLGERRFWADNSCLGRAKNHLFGLRPYRFPKDVVFAVFLVFVRKNWFSGPNPSCFSQEKVVLRSKSIFFLGKVCVSFQNQRFPPKKCVFQLLFTRSSLANNSNVMTKGIRFRSA